MRKFYLSLIFLFTLLFGETAMSLTLTSTAINPGALIPAQYTCDGKNISPPLAWQNAPLGTQSFVLIMDDPDAPAGDWVHWIVFNIPATTNQLAENLSSPPLGSKFGSNSWSKDGYGGPCPPSGTHRYYFKLYALDTQLSLGSKTDKSSLEQAMKGHILANAELMGKYARR